MTEYKLPEPLHAMQWQHNMYTEAQMHAAFDAGRASRDEEIESLKADAARYQWLTVNAYVGIAPHPRPHEIWCLRLPNPNDCSNLNEAINAAIAAEGK